MIPEPKAPLPWHRGRSAKLLLAAVLLLALYTVTGFWILPRIIASQLTKRLPSLTHRQASVGTVEVNPFRLTLTISNLNLTEPGGGLFASWERFHADLEAASVWKRALTLREVEVVRPILMLERGSNGTFNFANLIPAQTAPSSPQATNSASSPLPPLDIQSIRVTEGRIALRDRAVAGEFKKTLGPVSFGLTNFSTRRPDGSPGQLRIQADTGEAISWDGQLALSPPSSAGVIQLGPITIPSHGPYLNQATPAQVAGGTADVGLSYAFHWRDSGPDLVVSNAFLKIHDLAVTLPGAAETNLVLKELSVAEVSAELKDQRLRVGQVRLADGSFAAQRGSDGSVDLAQAVRPEFVERAVQTLHAKMAGWHIELPDLLGERLELRWGDAKPNSPVQLSALVERLQILGLSNRTNQPVTVTGAARWGDVGTMKLEVEASLLPAAAMAHLEFANVRLPFLQPYVEPWVNLDIKEGTVDGRWTVQYNRQPGGPLISAEGGVDVNQFLAFDTQAGRDFLKWDAVQVKEIQAAWEPATVKIREINLQAFSSSFVLMTNGQFNVLALMRTNPAAGASPATADATPASGAGGMDLKVSLDLLTLTNASLVAADDTVPGQFTTTLQRFSGQVTDLAWPEFKKSRVELAGFVGARAPFKVEGWVLPDPKHMFLDMHVTTANAELIPFTPYVIKFAGYPLKDGRVTADVKYQVDGQQVRGENHIVVDRLTLGAKAGGKALLDLPFRLGIALLKDGDGRITLDVPVKGSLDDPEFGVGKVVWQAVKGVFVKVATAPFKLLGSLFGGSEDDGEALQTVEFVAGQTNLPAAATNKLERLVTALNKRPELLVALRGGASPDEDAPVLARLKLQSSLRHLQTNSLPTDLAPPISGDTNQLLLQLFTNTFPAQVTATANAAGDEANGTPTTNAPLSVSEMESQLLKKLAPTSAELAILRQGRMAVVHEWLLAEQRLPAERVVLTDPADTNAPTLLERTVEFSLE